MNIQRTEFSYDKSSNKSLKAYPEGKINNLNDFNSIIQAGLSAKRPVILLGQGR